MLILFFTSLTYSSLAQNQHENNRLYSKARASFEKGNLPKALDLIDKSLRSDSLSSMAWLLKAEILLELNDGINAIPCLENVFELDPLASPRSALTLSGLYIDNRQYADAIVVLEWCLQLENQSDNFRIVASDMLSLALFRKNAVENPVCMPPSNLGRNVNTDGDEYVNQLLPTSDRLLFTRRSPLEETNRFRQEKVFVSAFNDNEFQQAEPVALCWDDGNRVGAASLSYDEKELYFVGIEWLDGAGRGDIYSAENINGFYCSPKNLGTVINTPAMESQPCISADGNELFFVRYSNSKQNTDVFYSQLIDGQWTKPKSIPAVNTDGNEMSPFLSYDGTTLFFASDRNDGMGGFDIFFSKRNKEGVWTPPVNAGYPINTEDNEICFVTNADGSKAYLSSDRDGGFGGYDIFYCETEKNVTIDYDDFSRFLMRNINFELNSFVLDASSDAALDSLASFLNHNTLHIEISGHADDTGSDDYNMRLSIERAESVRQALIIRDVDIVRMSVAGYGDKMPIAPNDSEENRALNRRVEFRFLK
ncbi:MAG: OmpA family protein [Candidatus Limimorpha sp.]